MNVMVVLIPVSLLLGAAGLVAFLWTVRNDQYDDDQGNAARILLDDDTLPAPDDPDGKND